jgi:hypothetical protein
MIMIRYLLLFSSLFMTSLATSGQIGIGTNTPDPSAQLDIVSTDKGLLIPRVTSTEDVTASPAKGLVVYQTSGAEGFYVYDGSAWCKLISANEVPGATHAYISNPYMRNIQYSYTDDFEPSSLSGFTLTNSSKTLKVDNAGVYSISYRIEHLQNTLQFEVNLNLNGTAITQLRAQITSDKGVYASANVIRTLSAGDEIELDYKPMYPGFLIRRVEVAVVRIK